MSRLKHGYFEIVCTVFPMELFFQSYPFLVMLVGVYMTTWFVFSLWRKRSDVADIAWGLGFLLVAGVSFWAGGVALDRGFVVLLLVAVWGIRLSSHVFLRNRGKAEDRRYAKWRSEWGKWFILRTYFQVFILQGVLLLLVSVPVVIALLYRTETWTLFDSLGIFLWIVGFAFEVIGDAQLSAFLRTPAAQRGSVLRTGLWRYTRHPNYFGEVTLWWGIFFLSLSVPGAWIGIVGPLTITVLILFVSGIPMLEQSMRKNPEFVSYAQRTSIFFPWFPKKG